MTDDSDEEDSVVIIDEINGPAATAAADSPTTAPTGSRISPLNVPRTRAPAQAEAQASAGTQLPRPPRPQAVIGTTPSDVTTGARGIQNRAHTAVTQLPRHLGPHNVVTIRPPNAVARGIQNRAQSQNQIRIQLGSRNTTTTTRPSVPTQSASDDWNPFLPASQQRRPSAPRTHHPQPPSATAMMMRQSSAEPSMAARRPPQPVDRSINARTLAELRAAAASMAMSQEAHDHNNNNQATRAHQTQARAPPESPRRAAPTTTSPQRTALASVNPRTHRGNASANARAIYMDNAYASLATRLDSSDQHTTTTTTPNPPSSPNAHIAFQGEDEPEIVAITVPEYRRNRLPFAQAMPRLVQGRGGGLYSNNPITGHGSGGRFMNWR